MPRGSGGVYTLPAGNPVVSGTVIASSWANPTMDDLGAALTDSLSRTGNGGMQAAFKNIDGVETSPSDTFNNDPLTGRYLAAVGDMRDTVSGVDQVRYTPQGLSVTDGAGGWIPVLGSGSGAILIQTDFTNVAGQTVFTTAEANSSADCYINGSLLANADYTFTLGNTITLTKVVKSALDVVSILGYGAFDLADPAGARAAIGVYSTEESDAGHKNYLINGDMSVWQRGAGPFASNYTADRMFFYGGVDVVTPITTNTIPYLDVTHTIGNLAILSQRLEIRGREQYFSGKTFTLSASLFGSALPDGTSVGWSVYIFSIAGEVLLANGAYAVASPRSSVTFNIPVLSGYTYDDSSYIEFRFVNLTSAPTGAAGITSIQIEEGSSATSFEYVSPQENLAACQRYYEIGKDSDEKELSSNGVAVHTVKFTVPKRGIADVIFTPIDQQGIAYTEPQTIGTQEFRVVVFKDANTGAYRNDISWTADAEL